MDEQPAGIAVDSAGNAYLVGTTTSPDFPLTSTAFGSAASGQACAFVAKINPTGGGTVWSVCLANSKGNAIALDASGNVYVLTNSSTVTKLTAAADRIVYTKTIAASAAGIAVDSGGNVYVAGSAVQGFPTTSGAVPAGAGSGHLLSPPDLSGTVFRRVRHETGGGRKRGIRHLSWAAPVRTRRTPSRSIPRGTHGSPARRCRPISRSPRMRCRPRFTARWIWDRCSMETLSWRSLTPRAESCCIPPTWADPRRMRAWPSRWITPAPRTSAGLPNPPIFRPRRG